MRDALVEALAFSLTAALNIVHILLNEKDLFEAIVELPVTKEFVPVIFKLVGHKKFKEIESKIAKDFNLNVS